MGKYRITAFVEYVLPRQVAGRTAPDRAALIKLKPCTYDARLVKLRERVRDS